MDLISKRTASIVKQLPSAMITLTQELREIGIEVLEGYQTPQVTVCTYRTEEGKKIITIEAVQPDA
jgi:hypothetical protein